MKKLFSVYDSKAAAFNMPFSSANRSTAVRDFTRAANDPSTSMYEFPEDYTLYEVGEFDEDLGTLVARTPDPVVVASSVIKAKE